VPKISVSRRTAQEAGRIKQRAATSNRRIVEGAEVGGEPVEDRLDLAVWLADR